MRLAVKDYFLRNPEWSKITVFSLILFFVFLADAILSYWVPNFLQSIYNDVAKTGLMLSMSSVVGLLADLILPQIVKGLTVRKLVLYSIVSGILFSFLLFQNTLFTFVFLTAAAMAVWGIYYELLGFAQQQFVADSIPLSLHSSAWGILGIAKNTSYFLGPLLGSVFFEKEQKFPLYVAFLFSFVSLAILILSKKTHERPLIIDIRKVNLFSEIAHWRILLSRVWPLICMSLFLGLIDAFFWSVGAIWNEKLAKTHILGGFFLSVYSLPALFAGFLVARAKIHKGKKKLAIKFFIAASLVLTLLPLSKGVYWQLLIVFTSSFLLSVVYPLVDGVYSDIVARMGRVRHHMIGLSNSAISLAYIVGPALAGVVARKIGEVESFAAIGMASFLMSLILFFAIPKKIRIPQNQISDWNKDLAV